MPSSGDHKPGISRRTFLGSSVTATVASIALPSVNLAETGSLSTEELTEHSIFASAFRSARPIWPRGRDKEMNLFVGFRAVFEAPREGQVHLSVAGATLYRIYLNGKFFGWGPARGPHDYFQSRLVGYNSTSERGQESSLHRSCGL